jgi:uncharacterized protein (TIGR02453 family)
MTYFNKGYIDFLEELHKHNRKSWFRENNKWYNLAVKEPFKNLLDDILPEITKIDPKISMETKEALFRINRDLRFSNSDMPYKTHMAAGFSRGGRKSPYAGYYLQIGRKLIVIGGGLPYIDREVLRKVRMEISYKPEKFRQIIQSTDFKTLYGNLHGEPDAELPKSFLEIATRIPVIAKRQIYYSAFYKTEDVIFKDDLVEFILSHYKTGAPLNDFLINAVKNFSKPVGKLSRRRIMEH